MERRCSAHSGNQAKHLSRRHLRTLRRFPWFISTIVVLANHPLLRAQAVTQTTPPGQQDSGQATSPSGSALPDLSQIPFAVPLPSAKPDHLDEQSDTASQHGDLDLLSGDVDIHYRDREVRADSMQLNRDTGDLIARGHVRVTETGDNSFLQASHGTYNLRTGTGRFYDVSGSVGLHNDLTAPSSGTARLGLASPNPFLFTGQIVDKTGVATYTIHDGTVTSCLLPRPDWLFSAHQLAVADGKIHASNATFHLLGFPVLFFPILTAPADAGQRQSGILIPVFGDSSTKGITVGEEAYFTLGRSADLTLGTIYYSLRGFSESGTLRYKGLGENFISTHLSALQDRGYTADNGVYVNQGGQDVTAAFRRQLSSDIRAVGDGEYLSSFVYREAFTESFNQAVSSDITSIGYITRETDGWSLDGRVDRYQGLKVVPIGTSPGEQVHILHVPSFDLFGVDRPIPGTPLLWTLDASVAGLKRAQPDFTSSGIIQRFDLRPELSLPVHLGGWSVLGTVATEETAYSRSRIAPYLASAAPVESTEGLNRADVEFRAEVRPPVLERDFAVPQRLQRFFGTELRHTIEPEVTYEDVKGVDNFLNVLRFDETDLVSDTNQLEYGLTQHLYFRPKPKKPVPLPAGCPAVAQGPASGPNASPRSDQNANGNQAAQDNLATAEDTVPDVLTPTEGDSTDANGIVVASADTPEQPLRTHAHRASRCNPSQQAAQEPLVSWRLAQRYFFDPTFGHAVVLHRRNIFESTLSLSGIAFLTEPRNISPLVSRLRLRTSGHTDFEWDFDYDTGAKKFTSSNVYVDAHAGSVFGGVSYARLNAPGRFATEVIDTSTSAASLITSPVSNFSQLRLLLGYGVPSKPGLAVATNVGLDLLGGDVQYAAVQTSYNWNCCGLGVEYRKYNLGTVRDENSYRFNFTLANIGSAGNIRRTERLF